MEQGHVRLDALEVLVLDEADRMLDMGFIHDDPPHHRGAAAPAADPAVLGDHAARDPELARPILVNPVEVAVAPVATTADEDRPSGCCFVERERQARAAAATCCAIRR